MNVYFEPGLLKQVEALAERRKVSKSAVIEAAVLSLVALYALFDRLGQYLPFIGLNTHGGVIFAYLGVAH